MSITESQKQAQYRYAKKALKRIPLDVPKAKYDQIKEAATNAGESVNGYIKSAIDEKMQRQGFFSQDDVVPENPDSTGSDVDVPHDLK